MIYLTVTLYVCGALMAWSSTQVYNDEGEPNLYLKLLLVAVWPILATARFLTDEGYDK